VAPPLLCANERENFVWCAPCIAFIIIRYTYHIRHHHSLSFMLMAATLCVRGLYMHDDDGRGVSRKVPSRIKPFFIKALLLASYSSLTHTPKKKKSQLVN
jgi:hypothetical protein